MKEYNKEKLHEYAKELFALCLEKNIDFKLCKTFNRMYIGYRKGFSYIKIGACYISELKYSKKAFSIETGSEYDFYPIWELIEKVKQL